MWAFVKETCIREDFLAPEFAFQVLQDPVSFMLDASGNAIISVRSFVSQVNVKIFMEILFCNNFKSNATQCIITTSVATVFCAFCNVAVLRTVLQYRSELYDVFEI